MKSISMFLETVPLRKYSHRTNTSMALDDYKMGLAAPDKPTLVLVGSDDEAFSSEVLEKVFAKYTEAEVNSIEGATHNGVRHSSNSFTFIKNWFSGL